MYWLTKVKGQSPGDNVLEGSTMSAFISWLVTGDFADQDSLRLRFVKKAVSQFRKVLTRLR